MDETRAELEKRLQCQDKQVQQASDQLQLLQQERAGLEAQLAAAMAQHASALESKDRKLVGLLLLVQRLACSATEQAASCGVFQASTQAASEAKVAELKMAVAEVEAKLQQAVVDLTLANEQHQREKAEFQAEYEKLEATAALGKDHKTFLDNELKIAFAKHER